MYRKDELLSELIRVTKDGKWVWHKSANEYYIWTVSDLKISIKTESRTWDDKPCFVTSLTITDRLGNLIDKTSNVDVLYDVIRKQWDVESDSRIDKILVDLRRE